MLPYSAVDLQDAIRRNLVPAPARPARSGSEATRRPTLLVTWRERLAGLILN